MFLSLLLTLATAVVSIVVLQPGLLLQAQEDGLVVEVPTPSPLLLELNGPTPQVAAFQISIATPTPAPTPTPSPTPTTTATDDCDGKDIHINNQDGEDVHVDVNCNKTIEGGGSISNSVDINARAGGSSESGDVKVDVNISNSVGNND